MGLDLKSAKDAAQRPAVERVSDAGRCPTFCDECFLERAAIAEFEGGLGRPAAEALAKKQVHLCRSKHER